MWRILYSATRGARTVKPSHCCTQDTAEETNLYHSDQNTSWPQPVVLRRYASREEAAKNNAICCFHTVNFCVCKRIAKWSGCKRTSKTKKSCHTKLVWAWEVPPEISLHDKSNCVCFQERQQQHLQKSSVLNGTGLGPSASLTRILNYPYLYLPDANSNDETDLTPFKNKTRFKCSHGTYHSKNTEYRGCKKCHHDQKNATGVDHRLHEHSSNSHKPYPSWGYPHGLQGQNLNQDLPNFFNPEVNKSLFALLSATEAYEPLADREDRKENRKDTSSQTLVADVKEISDFYVNGELQIKIDNQELKRQSRENRTDDSGYSERGQKRKHFISTKEDCHTQSRDTEDILIETPSKRSEGSDTTSSEEEDSSENELVLEQRILINGSGQFSFEQPLDDTEKSVNRLLGKEEVLIEDCSCYDSCQRNSSCSVGPAAKKQHATVQLAAKKHKASTVSIDDFSDGLKEILEAGRKDLNDFNTQFLGVLEGDIGRSISSEAPTLAIEYFRSGALLGDPSSCFNLALCYHLGRGIEQDLKMARDLYEAASLAGHGWATYNLAVLLSEGQGGPVDIVKAQTLLIEAGKMGVREAQLALEQMEEIQENTAVNHVKKTELHSHKKKGSPGDVQSNRRRSLLSVLSEPVLSSILSREWSSSYSTSDLEFLEDSFDQHSEASSSFSNESFGKATFYLV